MKTTILLITALIIGTQATKAQVLYSENFDNLTLGNVGTDFTGATPGKGGWHTKSQAWEVPSQNSNNYFNIVNEPGRGKVLALSSSVGKGSFFLQKRGIDVLWNNRNPGNNIMKIELDFYTGDQFSSGGSTTTFQGALCTAQSNFDFNPNSSDDIGLFYSDVSKKNFSFYSFAIRCQSGIFMSHNLQMWLKLVYYLDFANHKIYLEIPTANETFQCDLEIDENEIKSILLTGSNWIGSQATTPTYKYDNIVISAVNTVTLNTQNFLSEKFQVFPNPATDLVNISNSDDIDIKGVNVYDVSGKLIKNDFYTNQTNVQMNISTFASGLYVFSIKTENGTVVKSVIKN